jgi:hypothetical protein
LKRLHRGSTVVQREVNGGATPTPNPTQPIKEESKKNGFHNFVVGGNGLGNGGLSPEDKRSKFHNALAATFDDRVEAWAVIAQAEDATDPRHARALQELKERCLKIGKRWPYSWQ